MKITVAENAGFCFGVRNAIELALEAAEKEPVSTLGDIINNSQVVAALAQKGVQVALSLQDVHTASVVIRSHGAAPDVLQALANRGIKVIDATCPFVKRIHAKAAEQRALGVPIVIIGSQGHPEIEGTWGWAGADAMVINSVQQAQQLPEFSRICVLGQTTASIEMRDAILEELKKRVCNLEVFDFICPTTRVRQEEAARLAQENDTVLVVGDTKSANTRQLFEIASAVCGRAYLIKDETGIPEDVLCADMRVAIAAGASTPQSAIERTVRRLRSLFPSE